MATDAKAEANVDLRAWAVARAKEINRQFGHPQVLSPDRDPAISEPFTPEEREIQVQRFHELLDRLEQIGTEEERRESCEILMKALAETRREEGRVF